MPQLLAAGHEVVATTRSTARMAEIERLGALPTLMDGLDEESVGKAIADAGPEVVIHQMTAITGSDYKHFDRTFAATNRLRTTGTDNLLAAARATGVRRFVAQSYTGWPNARTGGPVKTEDDPLTTDPPVQQRESLAAITHVEQAVTASPLESVVLRYGMFYGQGASTELLDLIRARKFPVAGNGRGVWSWIHVDDAASATVAALTRGAGIYNIVDDDPAPVAEMVPAIAGIIGAKPPYRVPAWLARMVGGEVGVSMLSRVVTADRYAFAESTSVPPVVSRWKRRNASCTMSSASVALPSIRYAIENISGRSSS